MNASNLLQHIQTHIPITQHMGLQVLALSENNIVLSGNGQANINVHGTAFAGSLYTICTLAAWGLVYSRLPDGIDLVLASGKIEYRRPLVGDIQAQCTIAPQEMANFLANVHNKGKSTLLASVSVNTADNEIAALFRAKLHARINS